MSCSWKDSKWTKATDPSTRPTARDLVSVKSTYVHGLGKVKFARYFSHLMALKILDAGGDGKMSAAVFALNYVLSFNVPVSSHSYWGGDPAGILETAVQSARAQGHLVVAAAGNSAEHVNVSSLRPCTSELDNVICVAATSSAGVRG